MVNFTCPVEYAPEDPVHLFSGGHLNLELHSIGWIVSGVFTLIACVLSFWLIFKHLQYYTCPLQQRHIVRILFMVPIYAIISWMSYLFYQTAIYFQTVRDCYEAVVLTSFLLLLLQYVGDTPAEQNAVFRNVRITKWMWPFGRWSYRPDGLEFLWVMKLYILQYAIILPISTLVTVILQAYGLYCSDSWMPWFGSVWISAIDSIAVSVAMWALLQFYWPIRDELKPYSPVLKFLSVKAIIFMTFWQSILLDFLADLKVIKASKYFTQDEVLAGLEGFIECFEMVLFGVFHFWAFSVDLYKPGDPSYTTSRTRAFVDVIDYRDWFYQFKESSRWIYSHARGRDFTIADDIRTARHLDLAQALGTERSEALRLEVEAEKAMLVPTPPWKGSRPPSRDRTMSTKEHDLEEELHARQDADLAHLLSNDWWNSWRPPTYSAAQFSSQIRPEEETLMTSDRGEENAQIGEAYPDQLQSQQQVPMYRFGPQGQSICLRLPTQLGRSSVEVDTCSESATERFLKEASSRQTRSVTLSQPRFDFDRGSAVDVNEAPSSTSQMKTPAIDTTQRVV